MSFPLWDLAKDLAVARALDGAPDPEQTMRRRIAAIAAVLGFAVALFLGGATRSWVVGVIAGVVFLAALWVYAERWPVIANRVRAKNS